MKQNDKKRFISLAGAGIVLICFFLPWVKFSCAGITQYSSGSDLGGVFWLVFISALVIVGSFLFFRGKGQTGKSKLIIIVSSLVALGVLLFKYIGFASGTKTELGTISPKDIGLTIQFGGIGTVIGFIIALFGSKYLDEKKIENKQKLFTEIAEKYKAVFGENLHSIYIYGSATTDDFNEKYSDINVAVILDDISIQNLINKNTSQEKCNCTTLYH